MENDVDFQDLSERSSQLVNRFSSSFQGFNVNRSLREIGDSSRTLSDQTASKSAQRQDGHQKAIKKYQIDSRAIDESLANISPASFTEVERLPTDVDGYLRAEFESMVMNAILGAQKRTSREFSAAYETASLGEWTRDKKVLEETLGQRFIKVQRGGVDQSQFGASLTTSAAAASMLRSVSPTMRLASSHSGTIASSQFLSSSAIRTQPSIEERTRLSNKMRGYAQVVRELLEHQHSNSMVPRSGGFPLVDRLMEADLLETVAAKNIVEDAWLVVKRMAGEGALNEDGEPQDVNTLELVNRAIAFLEAQFVATLRAKQAKIGSVSSPLDELHGYVTANAPLSEIDHEDDRYGDVSAWAIVYYAIRAGFFDVAARLVSERARHEAVATALEHRANGQETNNDVIRRVAQAYALVKAQSRDFYKVAVYNLLATAEATNVHATKRLFPFIQDVVWWRLHFVKAGTYSLKHLQAAVNETLASAPFDAHVVLQLHLLTCQFEMGIAHLAASSLEDGVHFAIALDHHHLLNKPRAESTIIDTAELLSITPQATTLNLVAMLRTYVKSFSSETDNVEALYYYMLVDEHMRTALIADLIVSSTRDTAFASYLATIPSLIRPDQWRRIVEQVALTYESRADFQLAISYWLLVDEYARVLEIYNTRMALLLTSVSEERDQLYTFGVQLFNDKQLQIKVHFDAAEKGLYLAFEQLLQLAHFFELYHRNKFQEALDVLDKLAIIPVRQSHIERCVENYRFISSHITKNFSAIIQTTIEIIMKIFVLLPRPNGLLSSPLYAGQQQTMEDLRERAQALTLFSGKIDFPMSGNTHTKLMTLMLTVKS
eukprot:gene19399-23225_t